MGECDRATLRMGSVMLAGTIVAVFGSACSPSTQRGSAPVTIGPTTTGAPIPDAALKSLGPRLPVGPPAPPTTNSLNRPPATSSKGPAAPVSQTHDPATPDCPAGDLTAASATDQPSYADGATVTIAVTVTNGGASTCQYQPAVSGGGAIVQTASASGGGSAGGTGSAPRTIWEPRRSGASVPAAPFYRLTSGQKINVVSVTWDQRSCPPPCTGSAGDRPPRGSYRAVPQLSGMGTVRSATFALT